LRVEGSGLRVEGCVILVQLTTNPNPESQQLGERAGFVFRVSCSNFRGVGSRFQGFGFQDSGSGVRVQCSGVGFRVHGFGFRSSLELNGRVQRQG